MTTKIESERKFLVKPPRSWSVLEELFDGLIDIKRISQNYLKATPGEEAGRIRKTIEGLTGDTSVIYHYNHKDFVEAGVHKETEKEISKDEFESLLKRNHPGKSALEKTRFVFNYNDQTFELDVFKGGLKGLAILEIELKSIKDKVELPPFLNMIKEVTKDERYTNYSLADKRFHKKN